MYVSAGLSAVEFWNQPPTRLFGDYKSILDDLHADGWDNFPHDDEVNAWVFNSYDFKFFDLTVPPKGRVLFEVELITMISIVGDCDATITFQGSDSFVLCPFLQFEVIQKGPVI